MEQQDKTFEFSGYFYDLKSGEFNFTYTIYQGTQQFLQFTEKLLVPSITHYELPGELIESVMQTLHLILGLTYWKLYCPKEIFIKTKVLTKHQAEFWTTVYTKGLGEFYYRNNINFQNLIRFPYDESATQNSLPFERTDRSLIGIGGGKDSIVVGEMLKEHSLPFSSFIVETQKSYLLSEEVANKLGNDILKVQRLIDPRLFIQNKEEGVYNGHIPISAVYAAVGLLLSVVFDYKNIIVGNERSANIGNVEWNGMMINHQWSKSEEFEKLFQNYIKEFISPDIIYFSLLRPWYEIKIVEKFIKYPQYFHLFSSCNKNFKITHPLEDQKWCGKCPKCAFMFLLFSAFLTKEEVLSIFGTNMFADNELIKVYRELLGIEGVKPFDCVGTPEETKVAFYLVHEKGQFNDTPAMQMFIAEVLPSIDSIEQLKQKVFASHDKSLMPEKFKNSML